MIAGSLAPPDATATLRPDGPLDLPRTLAPLAHGRGDPTIRLLPTEVWRATRTPAGGATLRLAAVGDRVEVAALGPRRGGGARRGAGAHRP